MRPKVKPADPVAVLMASAQLRMGPSVKLVVSSESARPVP